MDDLLKRFFKRNKLTLLCIAVLVGLVGFLTLLFVGLGLEKGSILLAIISFVFGASYLAYLGSPVREEVQAKKESRHKKRLKPNVTARPVSNNSTVIKVFNKQ